MCDLYTFSKMSLCSDSLGELIHSRPCIKTLGFAKLKSMIGPANPPLLVSTASTDLLGCDFDCITD